MPMQPHGYQPWRKLLVPAAKALGEVRAALNDLKKSEGDHLDALNAASTELETAAADLSDTSVRQAGMGIGYFFAAAPAMLGASNHEILDSDTFVETTNEEIEALRARLAANISVARDHLTEAAPHLSLKLDAILKSLKEGVEAGWDSRAIDELDSIWTIFHDPVTRFLGCGWQGLWGATKFGCSFFFMPFIISILGLGQWALGLWVMHVTYRLLDVDNVLDYIKACFTAIFGDSPHPKDPVGHVEFLAGSLLQNGIQVRAVLICNKYAFEFHGHPLTLVKKVISLGVVSVFKLLVFCSAVYALCGLAYGIALVAWRFSELPVESRTRSSVMAFVRLYRTLRGGVAWILRLVTLSFRKFWLPPTSTQPPFYSYTNLDPNRREIRLLKVQKSGPFRTPTYDLVIFPLDSAPPYDAMSYRWEAPCEIPCDDCYLRLRNGRLLVGHKVHEYSHHLASFWSTRWLWIDAVCINQSDDVEKFSQIGMMGDIYRSGKRTLVWLDSDPSISWLDLTLMHLLNRHLVDRGTMILNMSFGTRESRGQFANAILMRMWKVRTRLLRQSYWSRGWIVQEVVLAKAVVVIYGGQLFEWLSLINSVATVFSDTHSQFAERHMEQISIAALEVEKGKSEKGPLSRYVLSRETKSQISALGIIHFAIKSHEQLDLATLLSITMERECLVAQDKVFCLLGMVRDHEQYLGKSTDTVQTTFHNTAKAILSSRPDFILQCGGIGYPKSVTGLATWVPDWSVVSTHEHNPLPIMPKVPLETATFWEEVYRSGMPPATDPPPKPPIAILGAHLTIQAVKLSQMKMFSAPCLKTFPNVLLRHEDIAAIIPFQNELEDPYPHSGQTAEEAFARTLVGDRWWLAAPDSSYSRIFPAPTTITEAYRKCKEMVAEEINDNAGISDDELWYHVIPRAGQWESKMPQDDYLLAVKYFQNLVVRGKRVGLTVDGHACLVPHLTLVGDLIVVVPGVHRPIILRPAESGQWDLVGSCYAHGIMAGEIWELGEQVLDVFEIR